MPRFAAKADLHCSSHPGGFIFSDVQVTLTADQWMSHWRCIVSGSQSAIPVCWSRTVFFHWWLFHLAMDQNGCRDFGSSNPSSIYKFTTLGTVFLSSIYLSIYLVSMGDVPSRNCEFSLGLIWGWRLSETDHLTWAVLSCFPGTCANMCQVLSFAKTKEACTQQERMRKRRTKRHARLRMPLQHQHLWMTGTCPENAMCAGLDICNIPFPGFPSVHDPTYIIEGREPAPEYRRQQKALQPAPLFWQNSLTNS